MGNVAVSFPAHKLIARAEVVTLVPDNVHDVMTIGLSSKSTAMGSILSDQVEIDVGELECNDRNRLLALLSKYMHLFARDTKDLVCTDLIEMHIQTTTEKPVHFNPYRLSNKKNEIVNDKVQDLIEAGIVRESMSEYLYSF